MSEAWNHSGRMFNPESPGGCKNATLTLMAIAALAVARLARAVTRPA